MKKINLFFFLSAGILPFVQSQMNPSEYSTTIVSTCKDLSVIAHTLISSYELTNAEKQNDIDDLLVSGGQFYNLGIQSTDIIGESTKTYNCHAYAWHMAEGFTSKVWIGDPAQYYYSDLWNTCFEECNSAEAERIIYFYEYWVGNVNYRNLLHSAIKSSVSGKFESKWGSGLLIRHNPAQVPYAYNLLKYYKRKAVTLTSLSALLCNGTSVTFTENNLTPGANSWTSSSNLTAGATNGHSKIFTGTGSSGPGWVQINYGSKSVKKDVWIGPPSPATFYISGSNSACLSCYEYYNIQQLNSLAGPYSDYSWSASGPSSNYSLVPYGSGNCNAIFNTLGLWTLKAAAKNACGWSTNSEINVWVDRCRSASMLVYPNPVDDVLYIELGDLPVNARSQGYDLRLYDMSGRMVLQQFAKGNTIAQFHVSSLPNGIYFLHIYDEVSSTPEMHQIIVKH